MSIQYFQIRPEKRRGHIVMLVFALAAAVCLLLTLLCLLRITAKKNALCGSDAADRWRGDNTLYPFAQISVCMDDTAAITLDTVHQNRISFASTLEQNAITAEGATLWRDCFSGETTLSVCAASAADDVTVTRSAVSVTATAAGGDFFLFHPFSLTAGTYFNEESDPCTVLLDERAAWQIFGATDVAGLTVLIGGQPFCVTGVTALPEDDTESECYGQTPRIFVNYLGLRLACDFDTITSYEVILPNPIDGFAADTVRTVCGLAKDSKNAILYDNAARYSLFTLLPQTSHLLRRAIRTETVYPPFWENTARVTELGCILLAGIAAGAAVSGFLFFLITAAMWFVFHPIKIKNILGYFDDKREKKRAAAWKKKKRASQDKENNASDINTI